MTAFVIGNGLSRKQIDLNTLPGQTYGCNWLYKDFKPDVLVAVDDPISTYIQKSGYAKHNRFYTRKTYSSTGAIQLSNQSKNWASGPNALQLAVLDKHTNIVIIGFDFEGHNNTYNNVYANTEFYHKENSKSTYSASWKSQLSKIFKASDWVKFTIVVGLETSGNVRAFNNFNNVKIISIAELYNEYVDNYIHK